MGILMIQERVNVSDSPPKLVKRFWEFCRSPNQYDGFQENFRGGNQVASDNSVRSLAYSQIGAGVLQMLATFR